MVVENGYKNTEIGIIPKDWNINSLKNVCLYRRGSFPQPYGLAKWYDEINGAPFVQVFDIDHNWKIKPQTKRYISKVAQELSIFAPKESILLTIQGSIGRIAITQYDAYVDRTLLIFESFKIAFDKKYFCLAIETLFEREKKNAPGGIIKTITKEALSVFEIPIPPLPEQTAIANALSDMDELITQTEKLIEKKKAIKQGVMQELLRPKKGWVTKKLGEISYCYAGGTPSTFNRQFWDGHIPWLPSGRVKNNIIKPIEDETYITDLGLKNSAAKLIKPNSVLVAITGATCGNIGLLTFEASANQSVVAIEPDEFTDFGFIYYSLLTMRDAILRLQTGSAQGGVNLKAVKSLEISIPKDKIEQNNISQILFDFDRDVENLKSKLQKLKLQKQGMMQALLTGKIRLI